MNAGTQMSARAGESTSPAPVRMTAQMVIKQLRTNLDQTQNMAEMYREQVKLCKDFQEMGMLNKLLQKL